jgi:hypothetical protein
VFARSSHLTEGFDYSAPTSDLQRGTTRQLKLAASSVLPEPL